jgi:hypothetical protein
MRCVVLNGAAFRGGTFFVKESALFAESPPKENRVGWGVRKPGGLLSLQARCCARLNFAGP